MFGIVGKLRKHPFQARIVLWDQKKLLRTVPSTFSTSVEKKVVTGNTTPYVNHLSFCFGAFIVLL